MNQSQLQCYSCLYKGTSENFIGLCLCTENKGICEKCITKPMSEWKERPTEGHNLQFVPRLSTEYKEWYQKNVCEPMGGDNWSGSNDHNDGVTTYTYYEKDGITNRIEFNTKFWKEIGEDPNFLKNCRKTLTVKNFSGNKFRKDDLHILRY